MSIFKFSICLIFILLSASVIRARPVPVRPISVAREALETQIEKEKMMYQTNQERPERVSPGGPDPHHHIVHTNYQNSRIKA